MSIRATCPYCGYKGSFKEKQKDFLWEVSHVREYKCPECGYIIRGTVG